MHWLIWGESLEQIPIISIFIAFGKSKLHGGKYQLIWDFNIYLFFTSRNCHFVCMWHLRATLVINKSRVCSAGSLTAARQVLEHAHLVQPKRRAPWPAPPPQEWPRHAASVGLTAPGPHTSEVAHRLPLCVRLVSLGIVSFGFIYATNGRIFFFLKAGYYFIVCIHHIFLVCSLMDGRWVISTHWLPWRMLD